MLGKLRLALAAPLPEWGHTALSTTPRGLTTRAMPWQAGSIQATLDLVDGVIRFDASDGRTRTIPIMPARPIAAVWAAFRDVLTELGVVAELWDKPQERGDATPFGQDGRPRVFDTGLATSWFSLLTELQGIYDEWRGPFFGRSAVNFWWGGFDLTVTLFNGRHTKPRPGSNYLMRYDLDAEHVSVGFWPGDDSHEALFFGYVVPEPHDCAAYPMAGAAAWAAAMGEWVLPYESIRALPDRRARLRRFADTVLRAAADLGDWDLTELRYAIPPKQPPR